MASQETVRFALLGAGERGQLMFGLFAKKFPQLFKYVAVAEPAEEARINYTTVDMTDFRQRAEEDAESL